MVRHSLKQLILAGTALVTTALVLAACAGAPIHPLTGGAVNANHLTSAQRVVWYESDQEGKAFRDMGAVYDDPALQNYLQAVMERLYPQFRGGMRVYALKTPVPNAFMMANGSCYVQLGLLALLDNEAELATVLAHEGAHFVLQHSAQQHEYNENTATLGMALGFTIVGPLLAVSSIYGYSRDMEHQADVRGFEQLLAAGYAVNESTSAFERLDSYSKALDIKQSYFFADHPKLQKRIAYFSGEAADTKQKAGYVGESEYLAAVQKARGWVLQQDLARQDYKSLIFLLADPDQLAGFPSGARYYLARGYLLRNATDDRARAVSELRLSIAQDPGYAPAYEALGKVRMQEHANAEARSLFTRYLELAPDAMDAGYVKQYIRQLVETPDARNNQ